MDDLPHYCIVVDICMSTGFIYIGNYSFASQDVHYVLVLQQHPLFVDRVAYFTKFQLIPLLIIFQLCGFHGGCYM